MLITVVGGYIYHRLISLIRFRTQALTKMISSQLLTIEGECNRKKNQDENTKVEVLLIIIGVSSTD